MKTLVVIPTYNEVDNIRRIVDAIRHLDLGMHILVVDDHSPDGTGDVVDSLCREDASIHLIRRPGKLGLGTAYIEGFRYAIAHEYDLVFEIDADLSHDPRAIPEFLRAIEDADLVVGSRYLHGVNVVNWPLRRLILSYGANLYTRIITGIPIRDSTGGFKCFRRQVLESIDLDRVRSGGYAFQIEMNFLAWKKGFRIREVPIVFVDRVEGKSKMSGKIVREAIWTVWRLRLMSIFERL